MNMNYCTLENTSKDMGQALQKIREADVSDWSDYEIGGAIDIFILAEKILEYRESTLDAIKNLEDESEEIPKCESCGSIYHLAGNEECEGTPKER